MTSDYPFGIIKLFLNLNSDSMVLFNCSSYLSFTRTKISKCWNLLFLF